MATCMTNDETKSCKEAFDLIDVDGSGSIDPEEISAALASPSSGGAAKIFGLLGDIGDLGDDDVDFESFCKYISRKLGYT